MPIPLLNQLKHLERTTILWRERGKVGREGGVEGGGRERDRKRAVRGKEEGMHGMMCWKQMFRLVGVDY